MPSSRDYLNPQTHAAGVVRASFFARVRLGCLAPRRARHVEELHDQGAGALFDFGCYGANLMTWMMDNQRPLAVTAITQQFQPDVYPRVDDEATIVVEYATAQGIIQASWNWPFNRKDFEVYGDHGLAVATGGSGLRVALPKQPEHAVALEPLPATSATRSHISSPSCAARESRTDCRRSRTT